MESLDVLIGLATVFLTLALACTAMVEAVAAFTQVRSKNLERALKQYFSGALPGQGRDFVEAFYAHPLVQSLSHDSSGRPSYIPPHIVGLVVESLVRDGNEAGSIRELVRSLPGDEQTNRLKGVLGALVTQVGEDGVAFRAAVASHFDSVMDRASGWVKRRQQNVAFICAAVLVLGGNVDTFDMTTRLYSSPELRAQLYLAAQQRAVERISQPLPPASAGADAFDEAVHKAELARREIGALDDGALSFAFGWNRVPSTFSGVVLKVLGLVISIFAVSLGAPFWFDMLQKVMNIREAGRSPREPRRNKRSAEGEAAGLQGPPAAPVG